MGTLLCAKLSKQRVPRTRLSPVPTEATWSFATRPPWYLDWIPSDLPSVKQKGQRQSHVRNPEPVSPGAQAVLPELPQLHDCQLLKLQNESWDCKLPLYSAHWVTTTFLVVWVCRGSSTYLFPCRSVTRDAKTGQSKQTAKKVRARQITVVSREIIKIFLSSL